MSTVESDICRAESETLKSAPYLRYLALQMRCLILSGAGQGLSPTLCPCCSFGGLLGRFSRFFKRYCYALSTEHHTLRLAVCQS